MSHFRRLLRARGTLGSLGFSLVLAGLAADAPPARGSDTYDILVSTGDLAPGDPGTFSGFFNPTLNATGQTAFWAQLSGTIGGVNDDTEIFCTTGSMVDQIAREDDDAPDNNGAFDDFSEPELNATGQVAFWAALDGTSEAEGIFRSDVSGEMSRIARKGNFAPDLSGTFFDLAYPRLNDAGQVAFLSNLTDTNGLDTDDQGIFRGSDGTITQIAREGQAAPDGNGKFGVLSNPAINAAGHVAFWANLTGTSDDLGIYLSDGIDLIQVAHKGDILPGTTATITILGFTPGGAANSGLNDSAQVAYRAILDDGTTKIVRFTPELRWRTAGIGYWDTAGNWTLGIAPAALYDVVIDPATSLTVSGLVANVTIKSLTLGATTGNAVATLVLDGFGIGDVTTTQASTINATGELVLKNGRVLSTPTLSNHGVVRGTGTIQTDLLNEIGGQVRVASGESLTVIGGGEHVNRGRIEAVGGEIVFSGSFLNNEASAGRISGRNATFRFDTGLDNRGSMTFTSGVSDIHGNLFNNGGSVLVSGNATATFYDDIINNGVINVSGGSTGVFFGDLSGNGVSGTGTIFLEGDTRPGASPGTMTFGGDVNFGIFSELEIELGGTSAGTEFDQIDIAGTATLAGTLDVKLINLGGGLFTPTEGDSFAILSADGGITGTFAEPPMATATATAMGMISCYGRANLGAPEARRARRPPKEPCRSRRPGCC